MDMLSKGFLLENVDKLNAFIKNLLRISFDD